MRRVDLNVDIGEGHPHDEALLEFATSANVCCGEHAGAWGLAVATADLCRLRGVRVGVHPGFPDRTGMGRRLPSSHEEEPWAESVRDQIQRFRSEIGASYIKPHGALYNLLASLEPGSVAQGLAKFGLTEGPVMALVGSPVACALGPRGIREGFADRRVLANGGLAPRSEPDSVLVDPERVARQALALAPEVDSLCVHGDTQGCVALAESIVRTLRDAGWEVGP